MAQAVAIQATFTRIGFEQAAITELNANRLNSTQVLIGLTEKDKSQILKII
jgi:hypothetical protein